MTQTERNTCTVWCSPLQYTEEPQIDQCTHSRIVSLAILSPLNHTKRIATKTYLETSGRLKGIVDSKMNICWKCSRWKYVFFFIRTDFEKFCITSLAYQWIFSEWVPSEWESKQQIKTSLIHTTPLHQWSSCEVKSCVFVINKFIIETFLISNCCCRLKASSLSIAFSNKNVVKSESQEKYAQIKCWKHKMACGLLVDYCDVFISCLDSHSDGTHSLQKIQWWASDAMLNFSKSVLMEK